MLEIKEDKPGQLLFLDAPRGIKSLSWRPRLIMLWVSVQEQLLYLRTCQRLQIKEEVIRFESLRSVSLKYKNSLERGALSLSLSLCIADGGKERVLLLSLQIKSLDAHQDARDFVQRLGRVISRRPSAEIFRAGEDALFPWLREQHEKGDSCLSLSPEQREGAARLPIVEEPAKYDATQPLKPFIEPKLPRPSLWSSVREGRVALVLFRLLGLFLLFAPQVLLCLCLAWYSARVREPSVSAHQEPSDEPFSTLLAISILISGFISFCFVIPALLAWYSRRVGSYFFGEIPRPPGGILLFFILAPMAFVTCAPSGARDLAELVYYGAAEGITTRELYQREHLAWASVTEPTFRRDLYGSHVNKEGESTFVYPLVPQDWQRIEPIKFWACGSIPTLLEGEALHARWQSPPGLDPGALKEAFENSSQKHKIVLGDEARCFVELSLEEFEYSAYLYGSLAVFLWCLLVWFFTFSKELAGS